MKISRGSRMLSVLLIAVMLFTMTGVSSFAEGSEEAPAEETKNVLVFGASTSSGYGLVDFVNRNCGFAVDNNDLTTWTKEAAETNNSTPDKRPRGRISEYSYPWMLKQHIANEEFGGDLSKVILNSVCMNGMRTDELRAFLDEEYCQNRYEYELEHKYDDDNIGFLTNHVKSFIDCWGDGGAMVDGEPVWKPGESRQPLSDQYYKAQKYLQQEITKADVIVVDVCMNNFGTYLAERIGGAHGINENNYSQEKLEDIPGVSEKVLKTVDTLKTVLKQNVSMLDNEFAQEFLDAFIYCYVDCVTNFSADIDLIRELNPDAKIIALGVYNTLDGVMLKVGDQEVDFGALSAEGFKLVNSYIKAVDKNSNDYYYADVSGGIETFMNQIIFSDSFDELMEDEFGKALMENMYSCDTSITDTSFKEKFLGGIIEDQAKEQMAMQYAAGAGINWDDLDDDAKASMKAQVWEGADDATKEYVKSQVSAVIDSNYKESIQRLLYDAAKHTNIDLSRLMYSMAHMDDVFSSMSDIILKGQEPTDAEYELLHIVDRFLLYMGIGQHPSKDGCLSMAEDVITAYDKAANGGDTAYAEVRNQILADMADLVEMLRQTGAKDDIDAIIEKIEKIQEALDMIDEAQASMDELKEFLELKKQFEEYVGEALDLLGITMDDLKAQGEFIADHVDPVWVAEQIKALNEIIMNWPELQEEYKAKIEEYAEQFTELIDKAVDELIKQKDAFENSEAVKKIIEAIEVMRDAVKNMPSRDEIVERVKEALEDLEAQIEEAAASISQELADQIKELRDAIEKAVKEQDFQDIIDQLMPIGEKLIAIGEAVAGLPEYEEAMNAYLEASNEAMAGLKDRVVNLEKQMGELTAKSIKVDLAAKPTFGAKTSKVDLSWDVDEDAAGYILKVDGTEVEAKETETGLAYEQAGIKVGTKYTYEVTPYIMYQIDGETETIYGQTFKKEYTPKVTLKKVTLKKVKAAKKSFKATWKKLSGIDGYQVNYKLGKKSKNKLVKGAKKASVKIKKLKKGKKYTVKVRAYKTVNGKKYYGKWSKAKKVKVK